MVLTNITQIYDPVSAAWSYGPNMNITRDWVYGTAAGNGSIVAPGGLNANGNEQLIITPCGTPTPTPTPTATATPTPTATATATASATATPGLRLHRDYVPHRRRGHDAESSLAS